MGGERCLEEHVKLREFIEAIISRENRILRAEIAILAERVAAIKETAKALYPETMRRLEELNNAAARRAEQEKTDRLAYVQASEFKEWRISIDKDLREHSLRLSQTSGEANEHLQHRNETQWKWVALTTFIIGLVLVIITAWIARSFR